MELFASTRGCNMNLISLIALALTLDVSWGYTFINEPTLAERLSQVNQHHN
jgi:hypothetical protein